MPGEGRAGAPFDPSSSTAGAPTDVAGFAAALANFAAQLATMKIAPPKVEPIKLDVLGNQPSNI